MNKLILGIIVLALIVIVAAVVLAANNQQQGITAEKAIEQAKNFEYDGICLQVITPARHIETGATYDFPCSAIPEGWETI